MMQFRSFCTLFAAALLLAMSARAGELHGTVKNGTTGKAAPGIEVVLIQLQGGMQPVANSKTDGQGQFTFDNPSLGAQPMLVRAVYKGMNAIAYALRPGQNTVRYSYEMPYPGNAVTVKVATVYPSARLLVVASPTMQISGEGLESGGLEQGMSVYGRENVAANSVIAVNVSGTAPPLQTGGSESAGGGGQSGREAEAAAPAANIQSVPGRLDVLKWPLIAGFVGIFALGAMLLARKPVVAVAGDAPAEKRAAASASTS